jgi:hypothetical protein
MKLKLSLRLFVITALVFLLMHATTVSAHAWWLVWNGGW